MPRYDYHCPDNGFIVEVRHGVNERIKTWGELCEKAMIGPRHALNGYMNGYVNEARIYNAALSATDIAALYALGPDIVGAVPGLPATTAVSKPSNCTSSPKLAWPLIFSGVSRRRVGLPMIFQSFGSFSATVAGAGSAAASTASSP